MALAQQNAPLRPVMPSPVVRAAEPSVLAAPGKKAYYSRSQNLVIHVNPGKEVHDGSKLVRLGQKHARFGPVGGVAVVGGNPVNGGWGKLVTDDPELIAALDKRILELGDIMDEERFNQVSKSPAMIQQEAKRTIDSQNKLIADLHAQLAARS